ncbi:response regulator transcription factor [Shewanella sp. 1CM18E]|uniref:helix-turn-helix transcriptional regulator n=1 Tax=Shewanella sp. 1CM18E TaxID=2929169 RepID=UPI0020BFE012|nr:response regulator transcription factor [Shewanella sp. 1CM18E]MCK8044234.1 response regulator transcription factor [Shewanella sp. 1CM18E]
MSVPKEQLIYLVSTNNAWKAIVLAMLLSRGDSKANIKQRTLDNLSQVSAEAIVILDKSCITSSILTEISPTQRGGLWLIVNAEQDDEANIANIISLGFSGLITTEFTLEMLARALRTIQNKQLWFSRDAMSTALKILVNSTDACHTSLNDLGTKYTLSCRERQVFSHLINGYSNKEIAQRLHLSPSTVKCHVSSILFKTGKRSRSQINTLLMD